MSGASGSRSAGRLIAFGVFIVPLILLAVWVWEGTPESGTGPAGAPAGDASAGALVIALERVGKGDKVEIQVTFANVSGEKIRIVVPASPAGVLRIVKAGALARSPQALPFDAARDAIVDLLPGASYTKGYRGEWRSAGGALEAVYDSRGEGLPAGVWRGAARSGPAGGEAGGAGRE